MNPQTVVIVGETDIRAQIREALREETGVTIAGELCAFEPRHARWLAEAEPEIVILDVAARGINPLVMSSELRKMDSPPQLLAVLAEGVAIDLKSVNRLGADAIVTTWRGLRAAVCPPEQPAPDSSEPLSAQAA